VVGETLRQPVDLRQLAATGRAPGGPEVEHDDASPELVGAHAAAVDEAKGGAGSRTSAPWTRPPTKSGTAKASATLPATNPATRIAVRRVRQPRVENAAATSGKATRARLRPLTKARIVASSGAVSRSTVSHAGSVARRRRQAASASATAPSTG